MPFFFRYFVTAPKIFRPRIVTAKAAPRNVRVSPDFDLRISFDLRPSTFGLPKPLDIESVLPPLIRQNVLE
jgi:hypothetical protein